MSDDNRTMQAIRSLPRSTWYVVAVVLVAALAAALLVDTRDGPERAREGSAPQVDPAHAYSWADVTVRGGGWVTGIASAPSGERYVRTDVGGAYRWEAGAQRWEQMVTAAGVPEASDDDYLVESLAVAPGDGDVLYMGVGGDQTVREGRVLRSRDGGRTWEDGGARFAMNGNAEWRQGAPRLAVDPADDEVVWLGTRTEGLWRSDDGARTWESVGSLPAAIPEAGTDPAGVAFVVLEPGTGSGPTEAAWVGVEGVGVLRTEDGGGSWDLVHATTQVPRDADLAADGTLRVVLDGAGETLLTFGPGTGAARATELGPDLGVVATDPGDPSVVVVGGRGVRDGSFWRSTDGGGSWDALDVRIESDEAAWPERSDIESYMSAGDFDFDVTRPATLWFAEGMGVWRTADLRDRSVTFAFESDGIETLVSNDAVRPAGHPLLTAHWDRGVFRHPGADAAELPLTGSFGSAWSLDVAPDDPSFVVAVVDDHRFCCTDGDRDRQSASSTDGGASWRRFGSIESGQHPEELRFGNIAVAAGDVDNLVWSPSDGGAIHHSLDGGDTWRRSEYPGSEAHFGHFLRRQVLTADTVRGGTFYVLDVDGVLRSTDGGATWALTGNQGLPEPAARRRFNATLVATPGREGELHLALGLLDEGSLPLYRSTDGGDSWQEVPGLAEVGRVALGAPLEADGPPALYATGRSRDTTGLWRSGDRGDTWDLLSSAPAGRHQDISVLAGDPEVPGRIYVGFSGTGFVVGSPGATSGPSTGADSERTGEPDG